MVLIREYEQATRNATALQRRECADALCVRDAIVELPVNDEHRLAPRGDVIHRTVFLEILRHFKRSAPMFPFVEPELLGRVSHRAAVENAGVRDEALERVGPF